MTSYFTSDIDALEAYAAIENEKTIIASKVDNTALDKVLEKHSANHVGNKAELFMRLVDYAKNAQSTKVYKEIYKHVLDGLSALQQNERESRRDLRTALMQTIQKENLVHPLDSDKDKRDYPLPPMMSFEGQTTVFYEKSEVLAYCLEHMQDFITVDWSAFDKVMAKTNGYRDNKGNSILDDESKPLPPVTIGRVAREVVSTADIGSLPDKLGEIEFESADELQDFFVDVWELYDGKLININGFMETYMPQYVDLYSQWCNQS